MITRRRPERRADPLINRFVVDRENHDVHQAVAAVVEEDAATADEMRDFLSSARFIPATPPSAIAATTLRDCGLGGSAEPPLEADVLKAIDDQSGGPAPRRGQRLRSIAEPARIDPGAGVRDDHLGSGLPRFPQHRPPVGQPVDPPGPFSPRWRAGRPYRRCRSRTGMLHRRAVPGRGDRHPLLVASINPGTVRITRARVAPAPPVVHGQRRTVPRRCERRRGVADRSVTLVVALAGAVGDPGQGRAAERQTAVARFLGEAVPAPPGSDRRSAPDPIHPATSSGREGGARRGGPAAFEAVALDDRGTRAAARGGWLIRSIPSPAGRRRPRR